MTPDADRWQRLQAILDELLDLPVAEQERRLAQLLATDPDLHDEAAALLAEDRRSGGLLDTPGDEVLDQLLATQEPPASNDLAGHTVGAYQIVGRLGEGGMAVVYAARQQNPARTVALKIMRAGVFADTGQQRRFQREAENLARLSHPHIAAIHEAGVTGDGLHYFAMELVEGQPLDRYLAQRPAPTSRAEIDARLALFLAICEPLTHAHQRGVIHLDLKPANIMVLPAVTLAGHTDAPAAVKILDFGVARFVGSDAAAATLTQEDRAILGTLAYMSPEQAAGDRTAVDVRSDIYALGVLLHEMLTGAHPLDLSGCSLPEAIRRISDQPPPRPEDHGRLLRGDLATIIRKAMHLDPAQRYQGVAALAEDVQRTRDCQPILARPPSTLYQLRKIMQRHRLGIAFAAALAVTLVGAIVGTSLGLVRARQAEALAREEALAAEEAARFLERVFRVSDPSESRGNTVTARELLDQAVVDVAEQLADQPRLQGRLLATMGQTYRNLGLFREARPLLEQAVARQRETYGLSDGRTAATHFVLGSLLRRLADFPAAATHYAEALAIRERTFGADSPEVAVSLGGMANLLVDQGDFLGARALYERALTILARDPGRDHPRYAAQLVNLALTESNLGDLELAIAHCEEVVAIQRRALAADDLDLAWSSGLLASYYERVERYDDARRLATEALAIQEAALGGDHTDVAATLTVLARLHTRAGDEEAALAIHRRTTAIWKRALGPDHPNFAMSLDFQARSLGVLGRYEEAVVLGEQAREILARALPPEHPSIATNLTQLGRLCLENGDPARARQVLEQALALREVHRADQPQEIEEVRVLLARLEPH